MDYSANFEFSDITLNQFRRKISPNTKRQLFCCPNQCSKNRYSCSTRNPEIPQCFALCCSKCKQRWYVCINCPSQLKHFSKKQQYQRHVVKCHNDTIVPVQLKNSRNSSSHMIIKDFKQLFKREASALFFYYEQFNMGTAYLMSNAHFKLPNVVDLVRKSNVKIHLKITKVLHSTPTSVSIEITSIFKFILDEYSTTSKERKSPWMLNIPQNMNEARSIYLEGKHAVLTNLPYPEINDLNEHSYINIDEIIKHYLYSGGTYLEVPDISFYEKGLHKGGSVNKIIKTQRCRDISQSIYERGENNDDTLNMLLLRWSDDFEPTSSNKKNRNNGMWILTVSIMKPKSTGFSSENTFVLSLGKKGDDHRIIEDELASDIEKFNNDNTKWFFPRNCSKKKRVRIHVYACLGDSPEKYTISHITRGNGTYTSRWGHLIDIKRVHLHIPSCCRCREDNFLRCKDRIYKTSYSCKNCMNWEFYGDNNNLLLFDPPKNYPADCDKLHNNKLSPQMLTSELLLKTCKHTHDKILLGYWSSSEGDSYLKAHGLNEDLRQNIVECAENMYLIANMDNMDTKFKTYLMSDQQKNPSRYEPYPLPKVWSHPMGLELFVDAPMHLLFLGIMKDVHRMTMKWCSTLNIESSIIRQICRYFNMFFDMKLEWLKIIPIGGSNFSGWVSENWLALSRISKWVYSIVVNMHSAIKKKACSYDIPRSQWNMNQNRNWLKVRGLETKGNASKLRASVDHYINDPNCPLPFSERIGGDINNLMILWMSLHGLISNCMFRNISKNMVKDVNLFIKIFLSSVDSVDEYLNNSSTHKTWFSSWNYITLLNIPKTLMQYGSFQNIWEGGTVGEGILKDVKPLSKYIYADWYLHLTKKIYQTRSLNSISMSDSNKESGILFESKNFHSYKNISEVLEIIDNGEPLSVVVVNQASLYMIIESGQSIELVFDFTSGTLSLGHTYYYCKEILVHDEMILEPDVCVLYSVLLPLFKINNETKDLEVESRTYTMVCSNWMEISKSSEFKIFGASDFYDHKTTENRF